MISSIKTQIGVYFFAVSCKTLVNRDKYKEGSSCDNFKCGFAHMHTKAPLIRKEIAQVR